MSNSDNYRAKTEELANKYFPEALDLLGDPVNLRLGMPGRPMHLAPPRFRAKVRELRRAGWVQREIAAALGISIPTLCRHYRDELERGRVACRSQKGGSMVSPDG